MESSHAYSKSYTSSEFDDPVAVFTRNIKLVQVSWSSMQRLGHEQCGELVFRNLFALMPSILEQFTFRDELNIYQSFAFKNHALQVSSTITVCLQSLNDIENLKCKLENIGKILSSHMITPRQYPVLIISLMNTLRSTLKNEWSNQYENAWTSILHYIQSILV